MAAYAHHSRPREEATVDAVLIAVVVAAKYLLPLLLIPFPFFAGWANFFLDTFDGDLLIPLGLDEAIYQDLDKGADYVTYICMVIAAWRWPQRRIIIALFVFRSVGQALFFATHNEFVFFLFPNFLEPLFLVYATILIIKGAEAPAFYARHVVVIWVLVVAYKMQNEYFTHVGNIDRSEFLGRLIGRLFGG